MNKRQDKHASQKTVYNLGLAFHRQLDSLQYTLQFKGTRLPYLKSLPRVRNILCDICDQSQLQKKIALAQNNKKDAIHKVVIF